MEENIWIQNFKIVLPRMNLLVKHHVLNTSQQIGIAERKNRHLWEVARSLMFTMGVPKSLVGRCHTNTHKFDK